VSKTAAAFAASEEVLAKAASEASEPASTTSADSGPAVPASELSVNFIPKEEARTGKRGGKYSNAKR